VTIRIGKKPCRDSYGFVIRRGRSNAVAVGGNLTAITEQGDSNYGTFKFYLHGSVSKEAEEEINKREMENEIV
jgi:hypothetical protein